MARKTLTQIDIDDFRSTFCNTAYKLYVTEGYHGVTMRGIAKELACSPMMAYRYFENKEHVFAALRARLFDDLAQALESVPVTLSSLEYLRGLAKAYANFAHSAPHAYRLLYVVPMPSLRPCPEVKIAQRRTQIALLDATTRLVDSGDIQGDPLLLSHTLWGSIHGLVCLDLADQLSYGVTFEQLLPVMFNSLIHNNQGNSPNFNNSTVKSASRCAQ
jgi:AcrR family transcriptional regulator